MVLSLMDNTHTKFHLFVVDLYRFEKGDNKLLTEALLSIRYFEQRHAVVAVTLSQKEAKVQ